MVISCHEFDGGIAKPVRSTVLEISLGHFRDVTLQGKLWRPLAPINHSK